MPACLYFHALIKRVGGADCSPFIQFCHFPSNSIDSRISQYAASTKEPLFYPPAFIHAWITSTSLDRLTLCVLDLNVMTHRYWWCHKSRACLWVTSDKSPTVLKSSWSISFFLDCTHPPWHSFSVCLVKHRTSQRHYCQSIFLSLLTLQSRW